MDHDIEPIGERAVHKRRTARLLLLVATVVTLVGLSWSGLIERSAEQQHQQMLTRALVTFGIARSLNGIISVIQESEVALQPAGVGVTLAPGQILDPVNDLVERFSWVMLASAASSGIQRLLLEFSLWPWMTLIVAAAALVWAAVQLRSQDPAARTIAGRILLLAIFIRFAVPAVMLANHVVYELFLEPAYTEASSELTRTRDDLTRLQAETDSELTERGWFDRTVDQLRIRERLDRYQALFSRLAENIVDLVAVFVLQTILLPLLFLWALLRLWRMLWRETARGA